MMEVFSTVIVEISASACTFLPADDISDHNRRNETHSDDTGTHTTSLEGFGHERPEFPNNYTAKFLEERMSELNVSVVVISERLSDTASSLKLRGGWSEICAVRTWLLQFVETSNSTQDICSTDELDAGTSREAAVTEHCTESSDMPRRRLRKNRTPKRVKVRSHNGAINPPRWSFDCYLVFAYMMLCLQCFDAVGLAAGRASGL